jgi:hypothetical protein
MTINPEIIRTDEQNARIVETHRFLTEQANVFGVRPTKEEVGAAGLELKGFHRHDSRTGSWCASIAKPGGRGIYHLGYDPHAVDSSRSVWNGNLVLNGKDNMEALTVIRTQLADPTGRALARQKKEERRRRDALRHARHVGSASPAGYDDGFF